VSEAPQTIVELLTFLQDSKAFFNDDERAEVAAYIGQYPEAGDIMPGTGGVRKLRWGVEGRGKRAGVRVIYYYYNETIPVFLISVFAKNSKSNLSKAEVNAMKQLSNELTKTYKGVSR
jgi:hypothetical protein